MWIYWKHIEYIGSIRKNIVNTSIDLILIIIFFQQWWIHFVISFSSFLVRKQNLERHHGVIGAVWRIYPGIRDQRNKCFGYQKTTESCLFTRWVSNPPSKHFGIRVSVAVNVAKLQFTHNLEESASGSLVILKYIIFCVLFKVQGDVKVARQQNWYISISSDFFNNLFDFIVKGRLIIVGSINVGQD